MPWSRFGEQPAACLSWAYSPDLLHTAMSVPGACAATFAHLRLALCTTIVRQLKCFAKAFHSLEQPIQACLLCILVMVAVNFMGSVTLHGCSDQFALVWGQSSLMGASLTIPVSQGRLAMGTWQGIYLNEHRNYGGSRRLMVTIQGQKR